MTPERHMRAKEVFLAACERPPEQRAPFLDEACGEDSELRAHVEQLLQHHVDTDSTIEVDPMETQATGGAATGGSLGKRDDSKRDFEPGTVVADRYRIVALLGRGGMGEVYRAEDLILDQPVALKFLPPDVARNEAWFERLLQEVRMARRVTHANVCRVFDIGYAPGNAFISMEYVDGEDLGSLLGRIGRLSHDKALEIALQICGGLAAAHAKGILHRDLKPANIMLDGEGQARITDFGLAATREQIETDEIRAGTPAYMAPELFAGTDVSTRSDLYALGLVLYELFVGQPAYQAQSITEYARLHQRGQPTQPSRLVGDLDPGVEQVILRCLEKDPAKRPASALAVAAALPGSDVLATAMAAGVTPAPELVGAAEAPGGMRRPVAIGMMIGVVMLSVVVALLAGKYGIVHRYDLSKPPAVLAERARLIAADLGYATEPGMQAYGLVARLPDEFRANDSWQLGTSISGAARKDGGGGYFWYRWAAHDLSPVDSLNVTLGSARVSLMDPPRLRPNTLTLLFDFAGRLLHFEAVPPLPSQSVVPVGSVDWSTAINAAGLGAEHLTPGEPELIPRVFADARIAWTVGMRPQDSEQTRIEAAAFGGRPVFFTVVRRSSGQAPDVPFADVATRKTIRGTTRIGLLAIAVAGAAPMAYLNWRRRRSDRRGAIRLAIIVFLVRLASWCLQAQHTFDVQAELVLALFALLGAMFEAGLVWLFYVALEPYVRRFWPQTLIAWSRLLGGRLRDPLVGRDILIGAALGVFWSLLSVLDCAAVDWLGLPAREPLGLFDVFTPLLGPRLALASWINSLLTAIYLSLLVVLVLVLLRVLLRRRGAAAAAGVLLMAPMYLPLSSNPVVSWLTVGLLLATAVWAATRFGLVALMAGVLITRLLVLSPLTLDPRAWHRDLALFVLLLVAVIAGYGLSTALRRPAYTVPTGQ